MQPIQKTPSGYKQTEVGVIPEDWRINSIRDVVKKFIDYRGVTPKKLGMEWGDGNVRALSANNVQMGYVDFEKECYFASETLYKRWMRNGDCEKEDIILTMEAPLGNVAYIPDNKKYILSQRTILMKPKAFINKTFLRHMMSGTYFQRCLLENSTGSTAKGIQRKKLEKISVYYPRSNAEQKKIANVLSDADALIESLDKLIDKKKKIKQGAMQELLTSKRRLPGFSGEWEVRRLGELLNYEQPTKYIVNATEYSNQNSIPVLTAGKSFILGYTNEKLGIFINLPVIIFDDFTTTSHYVNFGFKVKSSAMKLLKQKNEDINLRFVFERMQLIDFILKDHKRYWISEYQNIEIETPKPIEQTAIAQVLSDMDAEIEALEQKRRKYQQIKQGMIQQLLTGKIRLVN